MKTNSSPVFSTTILQSKKGLAIIAIPSFVGLMFVNKLKTSVADKYVGDYKNNLIIFSKAKGESIFKDSPPLFQAYSF